MIRQTPQRATRPSALIQGGVGRRRGFTLVELMATLVVMAILTALALPSFNGPLVGMRLSANASEFVDAISAARSEAQRMRSVVVICPRSSTGACAPSPANWNSGWLIFVDSNGDDAFAATETRVRVHEPLDSRTSMAEAKMANIRIDPTGATIGITTGFRTIKLSDSSTRSVARYVVLGRAGRARVLTETECTNSNGCTP